MSRFFCFFIFFCAAFPLSAANEVLITQAKEFLSTPFTVYCDEDEIKERLGDDIYSEEFQAYVKEILAAEKELKRILYRYNFSFKIFKTLVVRGETGKELKKHYTDGLKLLRKLRIGKIGYDLSESILCCLLSLESLPEIEELVEAMVCALPHLFKCFTNYKMSGLCQAYIIIQFLKTTTDALDFARFYGNLTRLFSKNIEKMSADMFLNFVEIFAPLNNRNETLHRFLELTEFKGLKLYGHHLKEAEKLYVRDALTCLIKEESDIAFYVSPVAKNFELLFEGIEKPEELMRIFDGGFGHLLRSVCTADKFANRIALIIKHQKELRAYKENPLIYFMRYNLNSSEEVIEFLKKD